MCNDNLCALYVKDCNVLLLHNNLIASFKSPSCCFNSCCCSLRTRTFWCYFVCLHRLFFNIGLSHYTEIMVFVIIFRINQPRRFQSTSFHLSLGSELQNLGSNLLNLTKSKVHLVKDTRIMGFGDKVVQAVPGLVFTHHNKLQLCKKIFLS